MIMYGAMMTTVVCIDCGAENSEDAHFCKRCGKRIGDSNYIAPDLEDRLYRRIETKLKEQWLSKDAVEKDIALNAATKLSEWTKLLLIALGLPATIAVGILAFVGIKSWSDLTDIETKTEALKKTAITLEAQYKPLEDELPKLNKIATAVRGLEDRLTTVECTVAKFAPSDAISPEIQARLACELKKYSAYLAKYGLEPNLVPTVYVRSTLPEPGYDAYFDGENIYVKPDHANAAKVIHEFSHSVLIPDIPQPADLQWSYSAVEAGVANYLTADFLNSPLLDSVDLTKRIPITKTPHTWVGGQSEGGMAWGSYLWALRSRYGAAKATEAIVKAFREFQPSTPPPDYQDIFLKGLRAAGLDSATANELLNP
jgi:hypothetical protein